MNLNPMMMQRHHGLRGFIAAVSTCIFFMSCSDTARQKRHDDILNFALEGITIHELQEKFENGEYTSVDVTEMFLRRIGEIDFNGPKLNALIEINPDALKIAEDMDVERHFGKIRGPLHGIPVLVKDNFDTGDKMRTTAGSLAIGDNHAVQDAFAIAKLREAGAVILGKTNMSEWSNFRSLQSVSGWSSRGGQTKNPYVLDQTPCGSSSGSAVGVAADLCVVAVGTSTDGSIACPASMNGVVGIRPTVGLVSRRGVIPISGTFDTPGTFGRTVTDAVILLQALISKDPEDPATNEMPSVHPDLVQALSPDALKGKRIGVEKGMLNSGEAIGALLRDAIELMKNKGATIIQVSVQDQYYRLANFEAEVLKYEFKDGINRYLSGSTSSIKSLEEVIRYNNQHKGRTMPLFGQDLLLAASDKNALDDEEYIYALNQVSTLQAFIVELMDAHRLDGICGIGNGASGPTSVARCPSITVPAGFVRGLPVGLTFFGKPFQDEGVFAIAYAYEQASMKRASPAFIKKMDEKL